MQKAIRINLILEFEEYCINVRDYDPIDIEEQRLSEQPSSLTIEIDI